MPEPPLNATAASLLGFLHRGPMTGWDLVRAAEREIGEFWPLRQSQVYRELARLTDAGLVQLGDTGPRDRKPYSLSDAGRAVFRDWINAEPRRETIRFPLLLSMAFGAHIEPARLAAFLAEHRAAHERRLGEYEARRADQADDFGRATLDFGITYERAVLDWFDRLPETMTGGR